MNVHLLWLWLWYIIGASLYVVKRGHYMITGPSPVANNVGQYVRVAGVPLLFRFAFEGGIFWMCFSPQLLTKGLELMGWESFAWVAMMVTQFAPMAFFMGLGIDPMADWAIGTLFPRIPFLKDFWPQMPGPLPQQAVVDHQVVEQTTKVTQLQSTTTIIPPTPVAPEEPNKP